MNIVLMVLNTLFSRKKNLKSKTKVLINKAKEGLSIIINKD